MSDSVRDKKVLVAVTGSIAAYKACELVRSLAKEGADVTVAMTQAATEFVGPATFAAFTAHPVMIEQFPKDPETGVPHVEIAEGFDAMIVAPATADILGKAAHAIADNLVSTLLSIMDCPVVFVPAMNFRMWTNPATQEAVAKLREWGKIVIEPDEGDLATMHTGPGRYPETDRIMKQVRETLGVDQLLAGKKILITAGPTREPIDPVRFISNRSSGKMGYALAAVARDMGADVTLISGPVSLAKVPSVKNVAVGTADEMLVAVEQNLEDVDILVMAAAVADFQPVGKSADKIRRKSAPESLDLKSSPDIIKTVREKHKNILVAFSLQPDNNLDTARAKLVDKKADYIVVNSYGERGAAFDADTNHVWILSSSGETIEVPRASKTKVAEEILRAVRE